MAVFVRETIHHGSHFSQRDVILSDALTGKEVRDMLNASTYLNDVSELKAHRVAQDLRTTGLAEIGWVRFNVI